MSNFFHGIDWQDTAALIFFALCWFGYARYSDRPILRAGNLVDATNRWRLQWMREMLARDNRSVDAIIVGNLARSFTFFASTTIFILAALVSLLGYRAQVNAIVENIPLAKISDPLFWQVKIFLLIIVFVYSFFKYTWSMRQYNYINIFIGAAPDYRARRDEHEMLAERGAALAGNAAKHFNNGLRAYYFGLAALAWFVHPHLFMAAAAWVVYVTYRREFRSSTLKFLS